jgi:hypothetical protein
MEMRSDLKMTVQLLRVAVENRWRFELANELLAPELVFRGSLGDSIRGRALASVIPGLLAGLGSRQPAKGGASRLVSYPEVARKPLSSAVSVSGASSGMK